MHKKLPPENDKGLEKKAVESLIAREQLRIVVIDTAKHQAREMIYSRGLPDSEEEKLIAAGMIAFDVAFNVYLKNGHVYNNEKNFSPYFGWWARQSMLQNYFNEEIDEQY